MPGTPLLAVTEADLTVSFRTQYVSAALNEKIRAMPRGVVRGFRVEPGAGNDELVFVTDLLLGDSVMNAVGRVAPNNVFAITYRKDSSVTLDLSGLGAARYYVAFVPNYTIGATTDGEWRAYTEAEFENGDIDTDGGVFVCAAISTGNVGTIDAWDIMLAGESTTTFKTFMRSDAETGVSDSGPDDKDLVIDHVPNRAFAGLDLVEGSDVSFDSTERRNAPGSYEISSGFSDSLDCRVGGVFPVWHEESLDLTKGGTIVVQYWYKTDGAYSPGATDGVELVFEDESGTGLTASTMNTNGRAPTFRFIPSGAQTSWKMIRYEVKIPNGAPFSIRATDFYLRLRMAPVAGQLFIGRIQAWVTHAPSSELGDFRRSWSPASRYLGISSANFVDPNGERGWYALGSAGQDLTFITDKDGGDINIVSLVGYVGAPQDLDILVQGNGGSSLIFAGGDILCDQVITAAQRIETAEIRSDGSGTAEVLQINGGDGVNNIITEVGALRATSIRSKNSGLGALISFLDDDGSDEALLQCYSVRVDNISADFGGATAEVELVDSGGTMQAFLVLNKLEFDGNAPPTGTGSVRKNTQYENSIAKAWGHFTTDGGGGVTLNGGWGVSSISLVSNRVRVVLQHNLNASEEGAAVCSAGDGVLSYQSDWVAVNTVDFNPLDSSGLNIDPDTNIIKGHFIIFGYTP